MVNMANMASRKYGDMDMNRRPDLTWIQTRTVQIVDSDLTSRSLSHCVVLFESQSCDGVPVGHEGELGAPKLFDMEIKNENENENEKQY